MLPSLKTSHLAAPRLLIQPQTALTVIFLIGIAAGTVWVGLMPDSLQAQLNLFGQAQTAALLPNTDPGLFFRIFLRREAQAGFLWLIGMTAFSVPALFLTAAYGGFSAAALLSLFTVQAGLFGLPLYLATLFPQAFLYLPAVFVLFFWGLEPFKKTHLAGFLVLSAVIALGALAECFLNPLLLKGASLIH